MNLILIFPPFPLTRSWWVFSTVYIFRCENTCVKRNIVHIWHLFTVNVILVLWLSSGISRITGTETFKVLSTERFKLMHRHFVGEKGFCVNLKKVLAGTGWMSHWKSVFARSLLLSTLASSVRSAWSESLLTRPVPFDCRSSSCKVINLLKVPAYHSGIYPKAYQSATSINVSVSILDTV